MQDERITLESIVRYLEESDVCPTIIRHATAAQPDTELEITTSVSVWVTPANGIYVTKDGVRFAHGGEAGDHLLCGPELLRAIKMARAKWTTAR
jgi:hypothetical protein